MRIRFSNKMTQELQESVRVALARDGIVNIPLLAEQIRRGNEVENVALEDIAEQLMLHAQTFSGAMEFDTSHLN